MSRRTLVFDAGGVIVHWQPLALMRRLMPEHAHDDASARRVAAAVFQTQLAGDWSGFDRGQIEPAPLAERIAERTGYPLAALQALIAAIPAHIQPMPASVALLESVCDAGHRMVLLSNMPRPFADHLEAAHACFGWFEARIFSGRVGLLKPEATLFDHVRDNLALDLEHSLFIDDHSDNVSAARACGWQALHFESAAQCERALRDGGWL